MDSLVLDTDGEIVWIGDVTGQYPNPTTPQESDRVMVQYIPKSPPDKARAMLTEVTEVTEAADPSAHTNPPEAKGAEDIKDDGQGAVETIKGLGQKALQKLRGQ